MTNTSKKNAVRIMAWILAILMILSLATVAISIFVEQCGETEEVPHDHDGDGVADHPESEHEDETEDDHDHSSDGDVDDSNNADTGDDIF